MRVSRRGHATLSSATAPRDEAWFEALFRDHHRAVLAFARRRVPDHDDDVVAEVFAVAWRRRGDVPAEALPWLYRTAANHILHVHRGEARRSRAAQAAQASDGALLVTEDHGERVAAAIDGQALIGEALDGLAEADRDVLRLWAWEQLDVTQMAYVLGCTVGATRVRLHRAVRRLRAAVLRAQTRADEPTTPRLPPHHDALRGPSRSEA